jgi:protein TonB
MKRILPAFVIAALVHAALLTADPDWLSRRKRTNPRMQVITMRLVERIPAPSPAATPLPPTPTPVVKKKPPPKKIVKPKAVPKKVKPKPLVKKAPPPQPRKATAKKAPQPVQPQPQAIPVATAAPQPKAARPPETENPKQTTPVETVTPAPARASHTMPRESPPAAATVVMATPRYDENPPPAYPRTARKRGFEGTVVLEVFVMKNGRVGDLKLHQSSSHDQLDRSAMKAVKRWRFEPGQRGDRAVAMWVRVPIHFRLD